jgi:hypothetical protein
MWQLALFSSEPSTSSRAASRASRQVSLANDWDLPTLDGSGPNTSDSSWRFALAGYLLRMCQGFYRSQNPNGCSLIWKKRGTKSNRMLPVLGRAEPRTNGIGCGLSANWQTMTVTDGEGRPYTYPSGDHSKPFLTLLGQARNWPTPDTMNAADLPPRAETKGSHALSLHHAVQASWPTPSAAQKECTDPEAIAARRAKAEAGLTAHKTLGLVEAAHRCAGPPAPAKPSMSGKRLGSSGQLNPAWVTQLQGLPDGWLDLPDATLSRLSATRTRRGFPISSGSG